MHFVAMAAVTFTHSDELPDLSLTVTISYIGLLAVSGLPTLVMELLKKLVLGFNELLSVVQLYRALGGGWS